MENSPTVISVAAAALIDPAGHILMHRRPLGAAHGGLWEFPGGKLEVGETCETALFREIVEEIGVEIDLAVLRRVGFADGSHVPGGTSGAVAISLYICRSWIGTPACLEGEEIGWFAPQALADLPMPPLDYPLAAQLLEYLSGKAK